MGLRGVFGALLTWWILIPPSHDRPWRPEVAVLPRAIIQGDRVAAAACFLPLTVNPAVSKDFGTRHRAAIGLTEESDAATIVVSEQSGRISLALDGKIERGLDADRLRARLKTLVPMRKAVAERGPTGALD